MPVHSDTPNQTAKGGALQPLACELRGISKSFGAVRANQNVSLRVEKGEIHGIVGENGAGKSTLMSILYGFYEADEGEIFVDGRRTVVRSSADAIAAGIGMVHQHFMLVDTLSVLENVMLGVEGGMILRKGAAAARAKLDELARDCGLRVDPDALCGDLPVGEQQRVEVLKALYRGASILILDEPTAVLTPQESDQLFDILRSLRERGVTIIIITHKLAEIMALTDTVTVMRQGQVVAVRKTAETNRAELAELMVGRKLSVGGEPPPAKPGEVVLSVRGLSVVDARGTQRVRDASFDIRAGEIVGVAGVSGNGQSELLDALWGLLKPSSGGFVIGNREVNAQNPCDPSALREMGVAMVPEDRQRLGVVMRFDAEESAILGYQDEDAFNGRFLTRKTAVSQHCVHLMEEFDVRPRDPKLRTANFSGGNQQKLILGRELERDPRLLLVGQPTRGVDIGAIEFIHGRLLALRAKGCAILMVSVELDEILALSDRIVVMCGGSVVGVVPRAEATRAALGLMMTGTVPEAAVGEPETTLAGEASA